MAITAADVKKLREETGAGMMDCKKALDEASGDYQKALKLVEQRGLAKAAKKADRETSQGYVASYTYNNGKMASLVELLCETDFVARNEEFQQLAREIAMQVCAYDPENAAELLASEMIKNADQTVESSIALLSGKVGEKIALGRFARLAIGA